MATLRLPPEVEAVFREFRTCEFTAINRRGQPLTWPTEPYYDAPEGRLIVTSSIAFPVKAYNARRHPQVAMLFSDPTGAPLTNPPTVLVQGDATVTELVDDPPWSYAMFKESILRQPRTRSFVSNPLARWLFTFQFQRLAIFVQPRRILVWPRGDTSQFPTELEVRYVE
ncbi:MAG TPA: pyridoxamine 5'-phosphate oxidase family protein [Ktedonobacteraceae bacterium]|nr:pyridoxamine 5'-phosphate oxidase family protein [Ktedonobacteraceae bacterium]